MPTLNINNDLASTDGLETVTITQAGTLEEQTVDGVLRQAVSMAEIEASSGELQHGDVKYHVPAQGLDFTPAAGDTVTDADAVVRDVLGVDLLALESRYRLWCR